MYSNPEIGTPPMEQRLGALLSKELHNGEQVLHWSCGTRKRLFLVYFGIIIVFIAGLFIYYKCNGQDYFGLVLQNFSIHQNVLLLMLAALLVIWLTLNDRHLLAITDKSILYFWLLPLPFWKRTIYHRINLQDISSVWVVPLGFGTIEIKSTGPTKQLLMYGMSNPHEIVEQIKRAAKI
jgi:hypothetical protein